MKALKSFMRGPFGLLHQLMKRIQHESYRSDYKGTTEILGK